MESSLILHVLGNEDHSFILLFNLVKLSHELK